MHINPSELKEFVENNPRLVTRRESKHHPGLFVLKYDRRVFYDNLWHLNPLLMWCRGLVVDKDYNVVVMPFKKVFNYGENDTKIDRDEPCTIVQKINGFLGVVTYIPSEDKFIYSTTGSLDSAYVDLIAKWIDPIQKNIRECSPAGYPITWMFEICDETDPHIVYEHPGAYLIGATMHRRGEFLIVDEKYLDSTAPYMGCRRIQSRQVDRFQDGVNMTNKCAHEGYMVIGNTSGTVLKIKSPYYLTTKLLGRSSDKRLLDMFNNPDIKRKVDEEYFPLVDYIQKNWELYSTLAEQGRIAMIRSFLKETNNE